MHSLGCWQEWISAKGYFFSYMNKMDKANNLRRVSGWLFQGMKVTGVEITINIVFPWLSPPTRRVTIVPVLPATGQMLITVVPVLTQDRSTEVIQTWIHNELKSEYGPIPLKILLLFDLWITMFNSLSWLGFTHSSLISLVLTKSKMPN